ncbi:unnamed protein product [Caenorhabditis auriculariae]|uniref:Vacuolar protein sorting-associated protein 13 VPS13 adaptor binding domain-containing protein n=1 Tax=Caenorhabditis auriculariae TaxID=2777116 RepID=A0A8S1HMV5_9PELO|nr:unnamed protein product [Caenorhabditis auriculariae]
MDMDDVELQINRRTWTALLEMTGLLGVEEVDQPVPAENVPSTEDLLARKPPPFSVASVIRAKSCRIGMPFPRNDTRLGFMTIDGLELESDVVLNELLETLSMTLSMDGMRVDDRTPLYSEMYPERLVLVDSDVTDVVSAASSAHRKPLPRPQQLPPERRAKIHIIKYLGEDPNRECDLKFKFHVPQTMRFYYVHTHRFFCGLMDFWMQFNELQDLVAKSKKVTVIDGIRSRVLLDVDVACTTTIVMPMNQTSDDAILWQSDGLRVTNKFRRLSDLRAEIFDKYSIETNYGYDENIDCLLDYVDFVLTNMQAFEAKRLPSIVVTAAQRKKSQSEKVAWRTVGADAFSTFFFAVCPQNIFSKRFDLVTKFLRNLDSAQSHNVPLLTIITMVSKLSWRMTTDFYVLMRGVLEKNFADPLIPPPETVPLEILQRPAAGCEITTENKYSTLAFRLLFDNVELDLQVPKRLGSAKEMFSEQWSPFASVQFESSRVSFDVFVDGQSELDLICERTELIDMRHGLLGNGKRNLFPKILQHRDPKPASPNSSSLMSEAHIMMKKDEPPVLTLILCNAKVILAPDWLNDAKEFVLLFTDFVPKYSDEPPKRVSSGILTSRDGSVVERSMSNQPTVSGEQTFNVKITLRFPSTLSAASVDTAPRSPNVMLSTGMQLPVSKHALEIEFRKMIGKMSYKDARVLKAVMTGYEKYVNESLGKSLIPIIVPKGPPKSVNIGKLAVKTEHADLWILDDFQGSTIPLLRFSVSNLSVEKVGDRLKSSLTFSADYFNQKVFGWEPLIEKWRILRFLSHVKDRNHTIELVTETKSALDINITEQLVQQAMQFSSRWPAIRASFERDDFRNNCVRTRSDHLPYVMRNETGRDLAFTTAVDDVINARNEQRRAAIRWTDVPRGAEKTFEFPTRLLYSHLEREPPRQLIVRVAGWDEISPVNVDACGTYFRIIKALKPELRNARLLIAVTMEKDGKKLVTIRSSLDVTNDLPHPIAVLTEGTKGELMTIEPSGCVSIPLEFAHAQLSVYPVGHVHVAEQAKISWVKVRTPGEVVNQTQRLRTHSNIQNSFYWLCTAVRREYYPEQEYESIPGHSVHIVAPLTLQNLLPIDMEVIIQDSTFAIAAGKSLMITTVDITKEVSLNVATDRLTTVQPVTIQKSQINEGLLLPIRLSDSKHRPLDMYAHVRLGIGHSIFVAFWVPYWIVNKSGLPLVVQQDASRVDAAGQMPEHERAKDKNPLMFSLADENCPKACRVRLGNEFVREPGYTPILSEKFFLAPGVQALKLRVEHKTLPTLYYNVGVEVRAGTGRYKDTQVVLITSRFVLQNQSSFSLMVCHHDLIDKPKEHAHLAAQSSLTWNENFAERRKLCVRRADVKHWSCPFLIDRIGSYHVTMRDSDETPRFIRVEIILSSAVFNITFTDADYYPAPIRIDNRTDVPILYQQQCTTPASQHLRTICKARSHVDYAWDDLYGLKRVVLQVYENRSKAYDILVPGAREPLVYENYSFIQLTQSFKNAKMAKETDKCELVLETMQKGKVMLNKQNRTDGNSGNQLWKLCKDGCIVNVGMNMRAKGDERMVLDVLEKAGHRLMMMHRDPARDRFQRWTVMPDGRICLQAMPNLMMTPKQTEVCVAEHDRDVARGADGVAVNQSWRFQRQRPGSGVLDVECLHSGPTVVIRITDREQQTRSISEPLIPISSLGVLDISITMRNGLGISLVNGQYEELLYAHFGGIVLSARRSNNTYQLTGSVDVIQIDNQLLSSDRWQVLYCQQDVDQGEDEDGDELPAGLTSARPALKLEMNCTPMKHYDSFDCFRVKLCDMYVQLDELLLWKIVQMAQASDAAASVQQRALNLPPSIDLERHDPLQTRRWYFGTLDLEMGHVALSVVTVSKSGLPRDLRHLKQQFNMKLISFENASVTLPPFRQYHYFETSSFLLETLQKYYASELQKQTLNIVVTLDAFGNPLGLVTDLKDSFQGLFIEGDVQRFVAGLGYGLSNSVSKMASSVASGVGSFTFDQEHELKRRHNMIRSHSSSSTPLTHLYSGVKGLGVGVLGGATAIFTNFVTESKKNGIVKGVIRGVATGAVDTVTKPVQGVFDFVEGTASAIKEVAMPATGVRRLTASRRVRPPRLCRNLYHLLPSYNPLMANAQLELLRINGYSPKERLLDVETCLEQFDGTDRIIRQYVLISTKQCYICQQVNADPSHVIQRLAYKCLKNVQAKPPIENSFANIEVHLDLEERRLRSVHIWCSRLDVAQRLCDKILRAKHQYDHSKRTLNDLSSRPRFKPTDYDAVEG